MEITYIPKPVAVQSPSWDLEWLDSSLNYAQGALEYRAVACLALIAMDALFVEIAHKAAKFVYGRFAEPKNLTPNKKILKDLSVFGTYALVYVTAHASFVRSAQLPIHPYLDAIICGIVFVSRSYFKVRAPA